MDPVNVLHIDTERTWRGGENQVLQLVKGLSTDEARSHLVAPPDSEAVILRRVAPQLQTKQRYASAKFRVRQMISFVSLSCSHKFSVVQGARCSRQGKGRI